MALENVDYYARLGVDEKATQAEIKRAYRKKAHALHPDKNGSRKQVNDEFALVALAYSVLKDPKKREKYDLLKERFDPREKDIRARAVDALVNLFVMAVDTCDDLDTTDIKVTMLMIIKKDVADIGKNKEFALNNQKKYKKVLARLKAKDAFYANSMNEKIVGTKKMLANCDRALEVFELMLEMLDKDFSYAFDVAAGQAQSVTPQEASRHFLHMGSR